MHRVDLGEVAAQRPTRAHLDAPDRVRRPGRLGQRGVARRLTALLLTCARLEGGEGERGRGRDIGGKNTLSLTSRGTEIEQKITACHIHTHILLCGNV